MRRNEVGMVRKSSSVGNSLGFRGGGDDFWVE